MRALGITAAGGPEVLECVDVPKPEPRPGQIRIRVHAASINPADIALRASGGAGLMTGPPPFVPGMDAAGVVDAVTEGSGFDPGERVMAIVVPFGIRTGAQAEYIVVPKESVARIPAGMSFAEASTLPMNGMTAHYALAELGLAPGSTVAVTGGAGFLASYFIPMAKDRGLNIVADAAPADEELARGYGADVVVRRGPDVARRIRSHFADGVDAVLDTAVLGAEILPAVRDGGQVIAVRQWTENPGRGISARSILVGAYARNGPAMLDVLDTAIRGIIKPRVAGLYPLEAAAEAHRLFEAGGTRGRYVLDFASAS